MRYRFIALLLPLIILLPVASPEASPDPCEGYSAALVVGAADRTMWMCRDSHAEGMFRIAIGQGGVDKQAKGDKKTPLGEYELGMPRFSVQYLLFIPIGYPNDRQKAQGLSGGNIGIHGPHRKFLWLGKDSADVDWTDGCIAVGTDEEILKLGHWVNEQKITKVIIQ